MRLFCCGNACCMTGCANTCSFWFGGLLGPVRVPGIISLLGASCCFAHHWTCNPSLRAAGTCLHCVRWKTIQCWKPTQYRWNELLQAALVLVCTADRKRETQVFKTWSLCKEAYFVICGLFVRIGCVGDASIFCNDAMGPVPTDAS